MHREFQTGLSSGRHRLEPESAHLVIERQGRLEFETITRGHWGD
jgi:hypothetical protein